jgi:hypothetical protein
VSSALTIYFFFPALYALSLERISVVCFIYFIFLFFTMCLPPVSGQCYGSLLTSNVVDGSSQICMDSQGCLAALFISGFPWFLLILTYIPYVHLEYTFLAFSVGRRRA